MAPIPHTRLGKVLATAVTLADETIDSHNLTEFCREHLSPYKVHRTLVVLTVEQVSVISGKHGEMLDRETLQNLLQEKAANRY